MTENLVDLQVKTFDQATPATVSNYPPERRLTSEQLEEYLDRRAYVVAGTARKDGRPHAAMSRFVGRGTTFWLPTVSGSVRARNLQAQQWITLVVAEGDGNDHIVVIVEGPADVVQPETTPSTVRESVLRDWVNCWIRVQAERVLSYAAEDARLGS